MKLTTEQKLYLASIDSKKKRKKQKNEFKIHNLLFGNDIEETIESLLEKIEEIKENTKCYFINKDGKYFRVNKPLNIDYFSQEKNQECKTDFGEFISKVLEMDNVKTTPILSKEQLRYFTKQKNNSVTFGDILRKDLTSPDMCSECTYLTDYITKAIFLVRECEDCKLKKKAKKNDSILDDDLTEPKNNLPKGVVRDVENSKISYTEKSINKHGDEYISRQYIRHLAEECPDNFDFAIKIRNLII